MSVQARIVGITDIFEALTAANRTRPQLHAASSAVIL